MTATGHALVGTVIAAKVGNPALAIPIALASHFLCDALPHWDTGHGRENQTKNRFVTATVIDVLLSFALSYLLIILFFPTTNLLYAFIIIIVCQLPDWLTAPYLFLNWKFAPFTWIYEIQKRFDSSIGLPWGLINQAVAIIALIVLAKIF
jgi:ABC-type enterochelin transport system permease subunit